MASGPSRSFRFRRARVDAEDPVGRVPHASVPRQRRPGWPPPRLFLSAPVPVDLDGPPGRGRSPLQAADDNCPGSVAPTHPESTIRARSIRRHREWASARAAVPESGRISRAQAIGTQASEREVPLLSFVKALPSATARLGTNGTSVQCFPDIAPMGRRCLMAPSRPAVRSRIGSGVVRRHASPSEAGVPAKHAWGDSVTYDPGHFIALSICSNVRSAQTMLAVDFPRPGIIIDRSRAARHCRGLHRLDPVDGGSPVRAECVKELKQP